MIFCNKKGYNNSMVNINKRLRKAAMAGSAGELKYLLRDPGCNALSKDDAGWTALMGAAWKGHKACVKLLLPASDAMSKDHEGTTALMRAAYRGHEACVGLLLPVSDALAKNSGGMTALTLTAYSGHEACVRLLLPVGNALAADNGGLTAGAWARNRGHEGLAQFIEASALAQSERAAIKVVVGDGVRHGRVVLRV